MRNLDKMQKVKFFILLMLIVFISSSLLRFFLYLLGNESDIFNIFDFVTGTTLPVIMFFFERNVSKKALYVAAIFFPLLMSVYNLLLSVYM